MKKTVIAVIALSSIVFLAGTAIGLSTYKTNKTIKQADALIHMGKYEDGISIYERVLSEDFDIAISQKRDRAKELLESKENYEKGLEQYESEDFRTALKSLLKVSKNDTERYSDAVEKLESIEEFILEEAENHMDSGDYGLGIELLEDYTKVKPDSMEAKSLKEDIMLKQGEEKNKEKAAEQEAAKRAEQELQEEKDEESWLKAEAKANSLKGTYQTIVSIDGNLREAPKLNADIIEALPQGTECYVYETKVETPTRIWCQVGTYYDGIPYEGWISYNTMNYKEK